MLDVNLLNDEDDLFLGDETILHNALLKKFTPIKMKDVVVKGEIHINSTALDVAKYYGAIENLEKDYEKRKLIAPVWEIALDKWITSLEQQYLIDEIHWDYDYTGEYVAGRINKEPLIFQVYNDITEGNDKYIYNYTFGLIRTTSDGSKSPTLSRLKDIAFAVALAYFLPKLKSELQIIKQSENTTSSVYVQQPKQQLKWTGTVAQFGFIMDLLIQGGYLEKPKSSFVKDAPFYLEHFNINTTEGTLAKELSENTNSIESKYRNRVVIPHKDNLSKSESMAKVSGK